MNISIKKLFFSGFVLLLSFNSVCQTITRDTFKDSVKKSPYFSIHKDNFFITGVPTNRTINSSSADAKYQISFKQIITRDKLPWDTYLFLTYTQQAFWNIYEDSFPFRDVNFNPTIALGKPIFNNNDVLKGMATMEIEHDSNGRDSISSRSWNRLTAGYTTKIFHKTIASFEVWLPFGYQNDNSEILKYTGLTEVNLEREFKRDKLYFNLMLRKGLNLDGKGVIRSRIYYNPFKNNRSNQYIMLEWYLGQAEGLLNYEQNVSMVRIGFIIKSNEFDFFR